MLVINANSSAKCNHRIVLRKHGRKATKIEKNVPFAAMARECFRTVDLALDLSKTPIGQGVLGADLFHEFPDPLDEFVEEDFGGGGRRRRRHRDPHIATHMAPSSVNASGRRRLVEGYRHAGASMVVVVIVAVAGRRSAAIKWKQTENKMLTESDNEHQW